jgi:23S rRNA (pseudouridine1915-N3)-methyltransferase
VHIKVVAVGKLKEKYWVQGIEEYAKRLSAYAKLQMVEVADEKAPDNMSAAEEEQVKRIEGERILGHVKPDEYVVALAIEGKLLSSEELATQLNELGTYGRSKVTFVIGGSLGLSSAVMGRADLKLSFSRMTFPHQLVRLLLVEQVYRGYKIVRGEPYHK